jgi:CysZ protein
MFSALIKGIQQLSDPKARQVVWMAIGAAILAVLVLWMVVVQVLAHTVLFQGGSLAMVLTWLMFPSAISAVMSLLLERIAGAVEARHYPSLPAANEMPLTEALIEAAKFLGIMVALNVAMLPFLFIPPLFPFVFYGVNGYLMGREFFELVATRRMSAENARALRKSRQGSVIAVGIIFAMLMTVPIVNLLTPVIATATMLHLFENWRHAGGYALTTT